MAKDEDIERPTMHIYLKSMFILSITTLLAFPAFAENSKNEKRERPAFSDFDGDGIRDDAQDTNNDGIPDLDASVAESTEEDKPAEIGLFDSDLARAEAEESLLTERDKFQKRKFAARGHSQNRGEFGAGGFGPNEGISSAVSSACPGGVCQ